jgi:epoxyqueuosine reductase
VKIDELRTFAAAVGLDAVGSAPAVPYEQAERSIADRRALGYFADMSFTMARAELSCHPERLLEGARSVISAALCYFAPAAKPGVGEGVISRHARRDAYRELRFALTELAARVGGDCRILVDSSDHVDSVAAVRAGVGFFGKNTLVITPRIGSWTVLGAIVTRTQIEPSSPLERDCGACRLCLDACPTGALVEPGVLDGRRCLSYWTQSRASVPEEIRKHWGRAVYGCDICQQVCPWNRGIEKRRARELPLDDGAHVSLDWWLSASDEALIARYGHLYVPRRDPRYLRRNALLALAEAGTNTHAPLLEHYESLDDEMLSEHARWALAALHARLAVS